MRIVFILFIYFNTAILSAQNLNVSTSKKAKLADGSKLKYKDTVSIKDTVIIKKGGVLVLNNETGWSFTLNEGKHSVYEYYVLNKTKNSRQDSIYYFMKKNNLFDCKFETPQSCFAVYSKEEDLGLGYIALDRESGALDYRTIETKTNLVTTKWIHPKNFIGLSYIIISNLYGEIIGCEESKNFIFTIDLAKYENLILIKVKSEDCIESREFRISIVKKP